MPNSCAKPVHGSVEEGQSIRTTWGATVTSSKNIITANLPRIRTVGLDNLGDVQSYNINRIAGSTAHVVQFSGGGHMYLAYSDDGKLLELSGEWVNVTITHDGHVSFGSHHLEPEDNMNASNKS